MSPASVRALVLVGPTAVGKTSLSLDLARALDAEIVSADSRQLYRGMDVGTASPSPDELAAVPHHLVSVADPTDGWSAGRWARAAASAIGEIASRGKAALVVGGSGLYVRALREGLSDLPADPELRARLDAECADHGPEVLHARLAEADPETAASVHPRNRHRVIRALEILILSGQPVGEARRSRAPHADARFPAPMVGLRRDRSALDGRIERRVSAMFDAGFLDEVRRLLSEGFGPEWPAYQTLGYPQAVACVRGELSEADAIAAIGQGTRRFARRQMTWFRGEAGLPWIDLTEEGPGPDVQALVDHARPVAVPRMDLDGPGRGA
jgi:tRNA dimethylallyltransferase